GASAMPPQRTEGLLENSHDTHGKPPAGSIALAAVSRFALIGSVATLLLALVVVGCGVSSSKSASSSLVRARRDRSPGRRSRSRRGTAPSRSVAVLEPPRGGPVRTVQVPVLTYHRVHT